jgi:catechol 2,3-dioxygenase-like lactoylglutathione lyase family enzyme
MICHLFALSIDAHDPLRLARFWSGVLGRELTEDPHEGVVLPPGDDTSLRLRFVPAQEPKTVQNRLHFDLTSSVEEDQQRTVARALELGGQHIDVGQRPDEGHVVLADPEGNEFCVIPAGNKFLAGCGLIGALACDGSQQVGYFWSEALGWPLVWDQDEETAIQSPQGGTKITWGGPPLMPRGGDRDRLRFDVSPAAGVPQETVVDRLVSLGAARVAAGQDGLGAVRMTDPDGNEFRVLASR